MSSNEQRDELTDEIVGHPIGSGYESTSVGMDEARDIAAAILAAGYRKPRTITTDEEADALPDTSVLLDAGGDVSQRVLGGWTTTVLEADGGMWLTENMESVELPATVLWEPTTEATK